MPPDRGPDIRFDNFHHAHKGQFAPDTHYSSEESDDEVIFKDISMLKNGFGEEIIPSHMSGKYFVNRLGHVFSLNKSRVDESGEKNLKRIGYHGGRSPANPQGYMMVTFSHCSDKEIKFCVNVSVSHLVYSAFGEHTRYAQIDHAPDQNTLNNNIRNLKAATAQQDSTSKQKR